MAWARRKPITDDALSGEGAEDSRQDITKKLVEIFTSGQMATSGEVRFGCEGM